MTSHDFDVDGFVRDGYLRIDNAFDPRLGETGGTFTTQHPGQRVDYIFAFGFVPTAIRSAWIETDRLATYASDHYPIGAEIWVGP